MWVGGGKEEKMTENKMGPSRGPRKMRKRQGVNS